MSVGSTELISGVGSTEPPKSEGRGFAAAGSGPSGVGSTEPPKSEGRGFAAAWSGPSARKRRLCRRREQT